MFILQGVSYHHPNKDLLFGPLDLVLNDREKVALTGNNGTGKSTLLKIIAGHLQTTSGLVTRGFVPYYIPQHFGQYDHLTIAQALGVADKLQALEEILGGKVTEENYTRLNDDWTIEERCREALLAWQLEDIGLPQKLATLSGGQKTKVFLAGIALHQPQLVLMDEPSNHLDRSGRKLLYDYVRSTCATLVVVSHDRQLLNLLGTVWELSDSGLAVFGGDFDFYLEQKQIERDALQQHLHQKEKALRKSREKQHETLERQQKLDARGKKKQEKAGVARILMNTLRNNAENSTAGIKAAHIRKTEGIAQELHDLRAALPDPDQMRFDFDASGLHRGKTLVKASGINLRFHEHLLWKTDLSFRIASGERIALQGNNGAGKTSLIRMMLGELDPSRGQLERASDNLIYIDQEYSLLNNRMSVYEQAEKFNDTSLQEHEVKIRLHRFLFTKNDWDKPCSALSGGERMRLALCCLNVRCQAPDMIILDEPTNNLDLQNIDILMHTLNDYRGTLLIVSHDTFFLEGLHIERKIELTSGRAGNT